MKVGLVNSELVDRLAALGAVQADRGQAGEELVVDEARVLVEQVQEVLDVDRQLELRLAGRDAEGEAEVDAVAPGRRRRVAVHDLPAELAEARRRPR